MKRVDPACHTRLLYTLRLVGTVYDSAVDESTSTDDEHCHNQENEVHEKEDVQ